MIKCNICMSLQNLFMQFKSKYTLCMSRPNILYVWQGIMFSMCVITKDIFMSRKKGLYMYYVKMYFMQKESIICISCQSMLSIIGKLASKEISNSLCYCFNIPFICGTWNEMHIMHAKVKVSTLTLWAIINVNCGQLFLLKPQNSLS